MDEKWRETNRFHQEDNVSIQKQIGYYNERVGVDKIIVGFFCYA